MEENDIIFDCVFWHCCQPLKSYQFKSCQVDNFKEIWQSHKDLPLLVQIIIPHSCNRLYAMDFPETHHWFCPSNLSKLQLEKKRHGNVRVFQS